MLNAVYDDFIASVKNIYIFVLQKSKSSSFLGVYFREKPLLYFSKCSLLKNSMSEFVFKNIFAQN